VYLSDRNGKWDGYGAFGAAAAAGAVVFLSLLISAKKSAIHAGNYRSDFSIRSE